MGGSGMGAGVDAGCTDKVFRTFTSSTSERSRRGDGPSAQGSLEWVAACPGLMQVGGAGPAGHLAQRGAGHPAVHGGGAGAVRRAVGAGARHHQPA